MNYYNEFDPKTAAWLRELIKAKLIPAGEVDERSIELVRPSDLDGFTQCHFFAGIGGWSYALYLAGWPEEREVWTGSCPCQPLSCAGLGKGHADKRHLWPHFQRLIAQCKPSAVFGEQVASKLGREWLAGIRADLEGIRYAVGALDLCAAGVRSPQIRQRLFWLADSQDTNGRSEFKSRQSPADGRSGFTRDCKTRVALGDTFGAGLEGQPGNVNNRSEPGRDAAQSDGPTPEASGDVRLDDSERVGFGAGRNDYAKHVGIVAGSNSHWSDFELLHFIDGKTRRIKSGVKPLAYGISKSLACVFERFKITFLEIENYAASNKTNTSEVLRMVRDRIRSGQDWEEPAIGMRFKFHAPKVLLDLLLGAESTCEGSNNKFRSKKEGAKIIERAMRSMRDDVGALCSPRRWESEKQSRLKPSEVMHLLPFILARHTEAYRDEVFAAHAALNRVTMLRGIGNAIVPPLAAEFIKAYLEIE